MTWVTRRRQRRRNKINILTIYLCFCVYLTLLESEKSSFWKAIKKIIHIKHQTWTTCCWRMKARYTKMWQQWKTINLLFTQRLLHTHTHTHSVVLVIHIINIHWAWISFILISIQKRDLFIFHFFFYFC